METIKLTLEIPAELATALSGFLESFTVVATALKESKKENNVVSVVGGVVEGIPTLDDVTEYVKANKLVVNAARFYKYYNDRKWVDSNGNPISNWKDRIMLWDENDRRKGKKPVITEKAPFKDDAERLERRFGLNEDNAAG